MANLITRTFTTVEVVAMVMDNDEMATATYDTNTDNVPITDDKKVLLKFLRKHFETDDFMICGIKEVNKKEELIGITPELFYKNGVKLDPTTRKPL